jgi:gliding motility-associated-like protein
LWTVQNATVVSPTQTDSLIEVTFGNTDANLLLKVTNQFGCDSSVAKTVQLLSAPSGSITGDSVVCINQNPRSYSIIGTPTSNYQWQAFDGSFLSTNTAQTVSVEWQKTGFQLLKVYVYENTTGCDSAFYKTIYADSVVKPQIIAVPDKGCLPLSTTLYSPNTNNLGYQFKWYNPQKTLSIQPTYSNTYSVAGTYPIWLKVNNTNGCVDSAYTQLYVNPKPTASADYIKIGKRIYTEDTVQFINNSTGGNKHVWYLPASLYDTTFNWNHAFALPGNYWVKLFAIDTLTGCMDSDIVNLEVWLHENLYVPNAFSPNADGKNDFFSIGLENITEFEVLIVNRWGQIVYQSTNPNFAWDGSFEGAPCQEDAYVYLVTAKGYHGKTFSIKGSVTLIR